MKIYTLDPPGFVPTPIAKLLDLPGTNRQAQILISAGSKAEAFRLLAARGMEPSSPKFLEIADGDDVRVLADAGFFAAPAVLATKLIQAESDVVRVEPDTSGTLLGRIERHGDNRELRRFVPTAAGVDGAAWDTPMKPRSLAIVAAELYRIDVELAEEMTSEALGGVVDDPQIWNPETGEVLADRVGVVLQLIGGHLEQHQLYSEDLVAAAKDNKALVIDLNEHLTEARLQRGRIAGRALQAGVETAQQVAKVFRVDLPRLYQMRDAALVEEGRRSRSQVTAPRTRVVRIVEVPQPVVRISIPSDPNGSPS